MAGVDVVMRGGVARDAAKDGLKSMWYLSDMFAVRSSGTLG